MNTYKLTSTEVWALSTLLYLPIETGSILAQWLSEFETPAIDRITEVATRTLEAKGYVDPRRGADIVPLDLLEGLTVLAVSPVRLTAAIQRSGRFTWSHFAQLKETIVQYQVDGDTIQIHAPDRVNEMPTLFVPAWFQVNAQENFNDNLPFGAFVMLATAFQLEDIQAALDADGHNITLSRSQLIDTFMKSQEWVDVYNAMGIRGIQPVAQMPIGDYLGLLLQRGYLQQVSADGLQAGPRAAPLRAAYSDPDRCTFTFSVDGTGAAFPPTGALVYGNGRLFLAQVFESGLYSVQQLSHSQEAVGWIANLVARGAAVPVTLPAPPVVAAAPYIPGSSYQAPVQGFAPPVAAQGPQYPQKPAPQYGQPAYASPPPGYPPQGGSYQQQPAFPPQGGNYQQPPAYAPQQPPKKSNRGCWIAGAAALIVICLCIVVGGVILMKTAPDLFDFISGPQEGQAPILVVNNSTSTICYLYVSPMDSEVWGDDILGNKMIDPGDSWTGYIDSDVTVDLAAVDCSDNVINIQYAVPVTSEGITYTLSPLTP